jgi:hypothetical protein
MLRTFPVGEFCEVELLDMPEVGGRRQNSKVVDVTVYLLADVVPRSNKKGRIFRSGLL